MAEYILRDQAIIAVTGAKLPDVSASGLPIANGKRSVTDCVRRLKDIPAADVRPVVLCKDCSHRDPEDHKCDCGQLERAGCVFPVDDDYFCAYGEKREES